MKNRKNKPAHNRRDYTGLKTKYLTAIKYSHSKNHRSVWLFKCKCGNKKEISAYRVANGIIQSCGCKRGENKPSSFIKRLYAIYKRGAEKRNYDFLISMIDFEHLINSPCYYCGCDPSSEKTYSYLIPNYEASVNGIDRKNNSIGYTLENCVSCCKTCNTMKMSLDEDQFVVKCEQIIKNLKRKTTNDT